MLEKLATHEVESVTTFFSVTSRLPEAGPAYIWLLSRT